MRRLERKNEFLVYFQEFVREVEMEVEGARQRAEMDDYNGDNIYYSPDHYYFSKVYD